MLIGCCHGAEGTEIKAYAAINRPAARDQGNVPMSTSIRYCQSSQSFTLGTLIALHAGTLALSGSSCADLPGVRTEAGAPQASASSRTRIIQLKLIHTWA